MIRAAALAESTELRLGTWAQLQADAAWVRSRVFIDEQGIDPNDEWDEADAQSLHCVAYRQKKPIGTGRLLPDAHIGRMAVLASERRSGAAGMILQALLQAGLRRGDRSFVLSAQSSVAQFYANHGFAPVSDPFVEVGIEHCQMRFDTEHEQSTVSGHDGCELYQLDWRRRPDNREPSLASKLRIKLPQSDHGRGIYLLHGLGEHCRRYDALAAWLTSRGWWVRAHDHRGHGRSGGARGVIGDMRDLVLDAQRQIESFSHALGGLPLVLGHSMGGGLAAELVVAEKLPVRGLVLSSPALALGLSAPKRLLTRVLNRIAPALQVPNGLDAQYLSHSEHEVAAYRNDPLVHNRISPRLVTWLERAGQRARQQAAELTVPGLLLVAGSDRLVFAEGSREFAERAGSAHLAMRWYDSAYHEIFNEAEPLRQKVINDLGDWLDHHFP